MVTGFCVKCRAKRDLVDVTQVTLKNNRPAIKGKCSVCGTTVYVIGKTL